MPFSGPDRNYTGGLTTGAELYQRQKQSEFDQAMEQARMNASVSSQFGENVRAQRQSVAQDEAAQREAAMSAGVTEGMGGGRDSQYSVADSPMMRSDSKSFKAGGKDYSYSAVAAGKQKGRAEAEAQNTADTTRFDALRKIPGVGDKGAARMVYGRAYEEADKNAQSKLLSDYIRNPSREAAAAYVESGGPGAPFPDELFKRQHENELQYREPGPQYGTEEYFANWQKMQGEKEGSQSRLLDQRSQDRQREAQMRPDKFSFRTDDMGRVIAMDPEDGSWFYTGATGAQNPMTPMIRGAVGYQSPEAPAPVGQRFGPGTGAGTPRSRFKPEDYKPNTPRLDNGVSPSENFDRTFLKDPAKASRGGGYSGPPAGQGASTSRQLPAEAARQLNDPKQSPQMRDAFRRFLIEQGYEVR